MAIMDPPGQKSGEKIVFTISTSPTTQPPPYLPSIMKISQIWIDSQKFHRKLSGIMENREVLSKCGHSTAFQTQFPLFPIPSP